MKKKGLLIAALLLIVLGIAFTSTNAYTFAKGYFLYKMDSKAEPASKPAAVPEASVKQNVAPELYPVRPKQGEEMGTLYIPKLKASLPIYHGTDEDELKKGVGHYAKSVLPGENDNSVLSGHRDTVFRRLGEVGVGDLLIVKTSAGKFTYKVRKVRIVDKNDRTVIVPKPRATLTVSTCYPFSYIGSAPQRYILIAYLLHN
ncbi:sortase A [Bacillus sp. OV322]|uniref:class D sortase n=1 Tax=Bacillus sp. OV322 TaxID=1882764 RepID=UPI0008F31E37|nr:class D sortase [Bacillus sp. OV322]SFC53031.1 sortase A [Bacillus sp. OV322]